MKNINILKSLGLWLVMACSGTVSAQTEHVTFQGVSLDTSVSEFHKQLVDKGYNNPFHDANSNNIKNLFGMVWDVPAMIRVIGNDDTQKVSAVNLMASAIHFCKNKQDKDELEMAARRLHLIFMVKALQEYACYTENGMPYSLENAQLEKNEDTGDLHFPKIYIADKNTPNAPFFGLIDVYRHDTPHNIEIKVTIMDLKNSNIEIKKRVR